MTSKIKNICAYFLIIFNFIIGALSVYTTMEGLTDKKHLIFVGIVVILGLSGSIAMIIDKAYKPLSDKMNEVSEGSANIAECYIIQLLELREHFNCSCKPHELQNQILKGCRELIKTVQQTIQNATGKKVRVCIKMIREENENELYTYCRDNITLGQCKNEHNQHIEIDKNTDFANILSGNVDVFIGNDLKKDYRKNKYYNTTRDFKYQSTIVAPISLVYTYEDSQESISEYFGFLCVDSKFKNFFNDEQTQIFVNLIKSTAHYLYAYLSFGNEYYVKRIEYNKEVI